MNAFEYWQAKRLFATEDELRNCMTQAKECLEQMNRTLSFRDEPFPLVHLHYTTRSTDADR